MFNIRMEAEMQPLHLVGDMYSMLAKNLRQSKVVAAADRSFKLSENSRSNKFTKHMKLGTWSLVSPISSIFAPETHIHRNFKLSFYYCKK